MIVWNMWKESNKHLFKKSWHLLKLINVIQMPISKIENSKLFVMKFNQDHNIVLLSKVIWHFLSS